MQDRDISPIEFHKVLHKIENCPKHRADIRNQNRSKVKQITKEQREQSLEQERKEGKEVPPIQASSSYLPSVFDHIIFDQ